MGIFDDPDYNAKRYGTSEVRGNPDQWRAAYEEVMGRQEAEEYLGEQTSPNSARSILGVSLTATWEQIKKTFRKLALKWHPDVCKEKDAESKFKRFRAAYSILADEHGEK